MSAPEKPSDVVLGYQSGVNTKGEPFVQLLLKGAIVGQLTPAEARAHAYGVLQAAEAAETDAFLFQWVIKHVGSGPGQAAGLLADFRKYRAQITGKRHGFTGQQGDWIMPEGEP
jgi:hypothetical protein